MFTSPLSRDSVIWVVAISICVILLFSCRTQQGGLFGSKRTPHQQYAEKLSDAGLRTTSMGSSWFAAADKSLSHPVTITLPYRETGYFAADRPAAAGYTFRARRGEKIIVSISAKPADRNSLFAELWEMIVNEKPRLVASADTTALIIQHETDKEAGYIVRMQPQLLQGIEYTISITTGPSLAFPVRKTDNPRISSLWGAERDGGSRKHEGIDIFAKKRTPVIAAADGVITSVNENNIGGKVVFMRPDGKDYNLYYAHLDTQVARMGQTIKQGDILGLMGNTGNAEKTAPHLHFGIYTRNGAVDPLPFVDTDRPKPRDIKAPTSALNKYVRNPAVATLYGLPDIEFPNPAKIESNNVLLVVAASDTWYKVILPDASEGYISSKLVTSQALEPHTITMNTKLYDLPDTTAAAKKVLVKGENVSLLGIYKNYYFAEHNGTKGWIKK